MKPVGLIRSFDKRSLAHRAQIVTVAAFFILLPVLFQNCSGLGPGVSVRTGTVGIAGNVASSISPSGVALNVATVVTITGTGFNAGSTVTIGGTACPISTVTSTQIICTAPASSSPSWADVVVTTAGNSSTLTAGFAYGALVIGQSNATARAASLGSSVAKPTGLAYVGGQLFVADSASNRVLVYPSSGGIPSTTASFALGNADLNGGLIADSVANSEALNMSTPTGVCSDGTRLMIADSGRNRILVYNHIPTSSLTVPDVVLGQADFTGIYANQSSVPTTPSANTLSSPQGIYCDTNQLIVADAGNNRVLVWFGTLSSNQSANLVLGQAGFTTSNANRGSSTAQNSLASPQAVTYDGSNLYVADANNQRVLIWSGNPNTYTSGQNANFVFGQSSFTSNSATACTATALTTPKGLVRAGNYLYVSDASIESNRVLAFNVSGALSNNPSAAGATGQASLTSCPVNGASGSVGTSTLRTPGMLATSGSDLVISDNGNNRVLYFSSAPAATSNAMATAFVGQSLANGSSASWSTLTPSAFKGVQQAVMVQNPITGLNSLLVTDAQQNRVLYWQTLPTASGVAASGVLGQQLSFNSGVTDVSSGSVLGNSLSAPKGVFVDTSSNIYLADAGNNRTLVFTNPNLTGSNGNILYSAPNSTNTVASFVLGQNAVSSGSVEALTPSNGAVGEGGAYPGCMLDGQYFVPDSSNNRILVFDPSSGAVIPPTSNAEPASFAIGQPDLTHTKANSMLNGNGTVSNGTVSAYGLDSPNFISCDSTNSQLLVADTNNNRIVSYDLSGGPISQSGIPANYVLGQLDTNSNAINQGGGPYVPNSSSLYQPRSAFFFNQKIYVADSKNNRIMGWSTSNGLPATGAIADTLFGQTAFGNWYRNAGSTMANFNVLSGPAAITGSPDGSSYLLIADPGNYRVLIVPPF